MDYNKRAYLNRIFSLPLLKKSYYPIKNLLMTDRVELEPGEVILFHKDNILKYEGTIALEIGAGENLLQNIFLREYLDYQYVIDISYILNIMKVNRVLEKYKLEEIQNPNQLKAYKIEYRAPFDFILEEGLENKGINFFISSSTFEHIPEESIRRIMIKLKKTLIKGSYLSIHIDYSDHLSHQDPNCGRNHFLQFSDEQWKKYNSWIIYQNRLRHDHYKKIFLETGFEIIEEEASLFCDLPKKVNTKLLTGNENDLATTGRWVLKNV